MPKYFIGTAGWSYRDWIGPFYPKAQTNNFDWLQYYSHYFNCVEVNSTYYSYISPKIAEGWVRKTQDTNDFLFTIKLHQDFTHIRKYDNNKIKSVESVLQILQTEKRLGGILIQFPYSFSYNSTSVLYISQLAEIFSSYHIVIELRHSSWNKEEIIKSFRKLNLTYCAIDQPQIGKSIPFEPIITSYSAYIRLHGRNKEAWFSSINNYGKEQSESQKNERYNYLYSHSELIEIAQIVKQQIQSINEIYIITNNHPGGNAVANAFQLINILEGEKVEMPASIIFKYPLLNKIML